VSSENVEIVRRAIEAYNRGDAAAALERSGLELDLSRAAEPLNGVYARGQIEAFWSELADAWESVWIEPHEFIDAGAHAVERICMYQERADALEAVGLRG